MAPEKRPRRPLWPWQKRWADDHSRFKVGLKSRRIGKTHGATYEIVRDTLIKEGDGGRDDWLILCPTERTTLETMETGVADHLRDWGHVFEAADVELPVPEGKLRGVRIDTRRGSRFLGFPGSPDAARGFGGNVYLDEFGFHRDPNRIWAAMFPVVTGSEDHRLLVTSTATAPGTRLHRLMTDPVMGRQWSRHVCDIHQAVAEGLPRDIMELRAALGDEVAWQREFLCQFVEDGGTWLDEATITAAESADAGEPGGYRGGPVFVGMDLAARVDWTIIIALEAMPGTELLVLRELIGMRGALFRDQNAMIRAVCDRYNVRRVAVDQTSMGEMPVQELQIAHGRHVVEGVHFTSERKLLLATLLRERFGERNLRIPADPDLRADLLSVRRETAVTGAPRLVARRTALGHADRFWALALAVAAAGGKRRSYDYEPAPRERHRWPGRHEAGGELADADPDDDLDEDPDPMLVGRSDWARGAW